MTPNRTPHKPPSPNKNATKGEREAARSLRNVTDAKEAAERERERQVVEAHRTGGGGPVMAVPGESTTPQGFKIRFPTG